MKKIKLCLLILGISILTLVSFTPQTQAKKNHNNDVQNNKPWNKNKSQILNQFMSDWGKINDYDLVSYTPNNNINFGGTKYPASLKKQKITVDHKKYTAGWSKNGTEKNDYNVVGCYSDGKPNQIVGHSLYLFTFHKNKPVILMVDDGQKLSNHGYEFVKAGNPELTKYFEKIINGKDAAKQYKQATSTERLGNNTLTQQQAVSSTQTDTKNQLQNKSKENEQTPPTQNNEHNDSKKVVDVSGIGGNTIVSYSDGSQQITYGYTTSGIDNSNGGPKVVNYDPNGNKE